MIWAITVVAHGILVVAYAWIAFMIGRAQTKEKQWRTNPLASATFMIFAACAIGHGVHAEHAALRTFGIEAEIGDAARIAMADPWLVVWTPLTALAALFYVSLRTRFRILQGGAPMVEDLVKRQQEAELLHDGVMVAVRRARDSLDAGDTDGALAAIEDGMNGSDGIIAALLGESGSVHKVRPGDLRRGRASK